MLVHCNALPIMMITFHIHFVSRTRALWSMHALDTEYGIIFGIYRTNTRIPPHVPFYLRNQFGNHEMNFWKIIASYLFSRSLSTNIYILHRVGGTVLNIFCYRKLATATDMLTQKKKMKNIAQRPNAQIATFLRRIRTNRFFINLCASL